MVHSFPTRRSSDLVALVALLAAFVLLMALVGAYLIRASDDDA